MIRGLIAASGRFHEQQQLPAQPGQPERSTARLPDALRAEIPDRRAADLPGAVRAGIAVAGRRGRALGRYSRDGVRGWTGSYAR